MEFDDINRKPSHRETSFYENINITSATPSNHDKLGSDEERYEKSKIERNVKKSEHNLQEDTVKRIKVIGSIFFALLVALYIGVIALVIVITVPKGQVHGGWSTWSSWSSCTVSCDLGMQHRDRSCTSPYPSLSGDHCFGESREDRICMPGAYGKWSNWGGWGSCSDSCGGGVRSRLRKCSNPRPSFGGKYCDGNPEQVKPCNKQTCPEHNVAFTAYNIYRNSSSYATLLFQNTHINNGNAYDTTTGKFTCNVPGVYHFVVTLTKFYQDIDYIYAHLKINGSSKLSLHFSPQNDNSNEVGRYMLTGAGTFHLNRNDVVDVYGVPNYFYNRIYSYFTGFLIIPDQ